MRGAVATAGAGSVSHAGGKVVNRTEWQTYKFPIIVALLLPPHVGTRKVCMLWSCSWHTNDCFPSFFIWSLTATSTFVACQ